MSEVPEVYAQIVGRGALYEVNLQCDVLGDDFQVAPSGCTK